MSLPSEFGAMAAMILFSGIFAVLSLILAVIAACFSPWVYIPAGMSLAIVGLLSFRLWRNGYL
jgi:hypothetical protein